MDIGDELKSLKILVVDDYISYPEGENLPVQGEVHPHEDITRGLPGGC